jgi:arylsulfatase A-like enzyme
VLLVIVDSVRSDFVGAYGAPRIRTPNIDALASQGVSFTRFFPEAMPTVPARRTIMTGGRVFPFRGWKRAPDLGRGPGALPIEDLNDVFATQLARAGYWTASASDYPFLGFTKSFRPGTTPSRTRPASSAWPGSCSSRPPSASPSRSWSTASIPTSPGPPAPEFVRLYADPSYRGPNPGTARYTGADTYLEPDELRQMNAVYGAALTIADKWLGEFIGRLRELGPRKNTALVFVSDHGILLGDAAGPARSPKSCIPS